VIVGNGNPFVGHAREATGLWRCSQGVRSEPTACFPPRDRSAHVSRGMLVA
jgi:hypothetical protein